MSENIDIKVKKKSYSRLLEIYIWVILAIMTVLPILYWSIKEGTLNEDIFIGFYYQFIFAVFIVLVPILFKFIFGKLPFEYLNSKKIKGNDIGIENNSNVTSKNDLEDKIKLSYSEIIINESKNISERIFSRSGVYLLICCLIAFAGIAIFY